jgi:transcriptional regulator
MSVRFTTVSNTDILRFAAENPLAWVVPHADPDDAVLMPLLMERDASNQPTSVLGHLPRSGRVLSRLSEDPHATCLFLGPHAYIPPGWISKPGWAPTWNFVSLKVSGPITLDDALTEEAVRSLVAHMETRAGSDWNVEQMGPRFDGLLRGIVGFRMRIDTLQPRFKTGQDETEISHAEIHGHLEGHALQAWMEKP